MTPPPEALFLPTPSGGQRFCLWHRPHPAPATPVRGRVLHLHPWAEEMNACRRMSALQARALADAGLAVLQFDLPGCGDSSGSFGQTSWEAWLDDAQDALRWLTQQAEGPTWLWGVRSGALLATGLLDRLPETERGQTHLLLWQPCLDGAAALRQFLRLETAGRWLQNTARAARSAASPTTAPATHPAYPAMVAGYPLAPALLDGLRQARLQPPTTWPRPAGGLPLPPAHCLWLDVTAANPTAPEAWQQAGWQVQAETVAGPAFWQTVQGETAPALIEATLRLLTSTSVQTQQPAAGGASAAADTPRPRPAGPSVRPTQTVGAGPGLSTCVLPLPEGLVGLLTEPTATEATSDVGVLVVAGGDQTRVGAHRQFVQLAQRMAAAGHPCLRFDAPGKGDSAGPPLPFEVLGPWLTRVIDHWQQTRPGLRQVVLWGLCDGASAALLHAAQGNDPRVAGLCLLNPWVRSPASLAQARVSHYYPQRLREADFWRRLLTGHIGWQALQGVWRHWRAARQPHPNGANEADGVDLPTALAHGWHGFTGPVLLLLSELDLTAQEFVQLARNHPAWQGALARPQLSRVDLPGADHTCATPGAQPLLEEATCLWLATHWR